MRGLLILIVLSLASVAAAQDATEAPAEVTEAAAEVTATLAPLPDVSAFALGILDSYFLTDNDRPLLGEPFELTLVVEAPLDAVITEWPEVQSDETLEVLEVGEVEVIEAEDNITHQQTLRVLLWQVGEYLSPEYGVGFRTGDGSELLDPVRSVFIVVPSAVTAEDVPRPSLSPIDLWVLPLWVYALAATVLAIVVVVALAMLQKVRVGIKNVMFGTPVQRAINQLEDLRHQKLPLAALYPIIANNLRHFIRETYGINAVEMTSDELMIVLREREHFTPELRRQLHKLLQQADLVKFARLKPDDQTAERLIRFAIKWLRAVSRTEKAAADA